jgi:hypothetical protein
LAAMMRTLVFKTPVIAAAIRPVRPQKNLRAANLSSRFYG